MTNTTPLTELEAVNMILATVGEAPVNSLLNQELHEAVVARDVLRRTSRTVQDEGWYFNTSKSQRLVPSSEGAIPLPTNLLRFELDRASHPMDDVVERGGRLFDLINQTYTFSGPIYGTVVSFLTFEELPQVARNYITIQAARTFADNNVASDLLHGITQQDEARARANLLSAESRGSRHNIFRRGSQNPWRL